MMRMSNLKLREEQLLALTEEERETGDDNNPILHAESGPNRFHSITLFFPEGDGVKVETDLDLDIRTVEYFSEGETIELTEGPLYDWAVEIYEND